MDLNICGKQASWIARTLGLLYFAFIALFIFAHAMSSGGLPSIWRMSSAEHFDTLELFLVVVGGVVEWKWEGVAAAMTLLGTALWLLVEWNLLWPPGLSLLIGLLYAFSAWSTTWALATES
jgi:hypothetical protein